jgi:hypothetical protein
MLSGMADDFDKEFQRARRHPCRIFVSHVKGRLYGIIMTSTCTGRPICEPIPGRNEIRDMDYADMAKDYRNIMDRQPLEKVDNAVSSIAHSHVVVPKTVYNALKATSSSS